MTYHLETKKVDATTTIAAVIWTTRIQTMGAIIRHKTPTAIVIRTPRGIQSFTPEGRSFPITEVAINYPDLIADFLAQ